MADIKYQNSYFNYRIFLKARTEGLIKKGLDLDYALDYKSDYHSKTEANLINSEYYSRLKDAVENEISILNNLFIKPIETACIIRYAGKNGLKPPLPKFLHIYDPSNIVSIADNTFHNNNDIKFGNLTFLTSSRFKNALIYRPASILLQDFADYCKNRKDDSGAGSFICIGTSSEAELEFIKNYSHPSLLLILPHQSFLNSKNLNDFENYRENTNFNRKNILQISALDPFSRTDKYGFIFRNNLAFHLSKEMVVFYLSKKSSLLNIIKNFKNAGKPVKIFEIEKYSEIIGEELLTLRGTHNDSTKNGMKHTDIQKFILKNLDNENITIDNLIKLSNIKFDGNSNEILKNISLLEMNLEIERLPGGFIKKLNAHR